MIPESLDYLNLTPVHIQPTFCIPYESVKLLTTVNDANMFGAFCFIIGAVLGAVFVYGRMTQRND